MRNGKQKPNYRNEYWVLITEDSLGNIWIEPNITFYSDAWHWKTRARYEDLVDYTIQGSRAVMYIIDFSEVGYDRCKECAFKWVKGEFFVYRLD